VGSVRFREAFSVADEVFVGNIREMAAGGFLCLVAFIPPFFLPWRRYPALIALAVVLWYTMVAWPLLVGVCGVCLSAMRGQYPRIRELFAGFSYMAPACAVGILPLIPWAIAFMIPKEAATPTMTVVIAVHVLLLVPVFGLGFPAVADGRAAGEALGFSARAGLANWPVIALLSLILMAITIVSIPLALAAGLVISWGTAVMTAAYLQVA
jgi:hypothetical protein